MGRLINVNFYTVADVAARLGLSPATLRRWANQRCGPPCKRFGKQIVYPKALFEGWYANQTLVGLADAPAEVAS
jgi:hypothetical protein